MVSIRAHVYAGLAVVVLLAGWCWHSERVDAAERAVHAHYAAILAEIRDKTAKAAEAFRLTEQTWQQSFEEIARDGQEKLDAARRDAADAGRAADGLRAALNRYRTTTRPAPDTGIAGASEGESNSNALDLLTGMLSRHTRELVEIGAYADQLRAAGLTCERSADSLVE